MKIRIIFDYPGYGGEGNPRGILPKPHRHLPHLSIPLPAELPYRQGLFALGVDRQVQDAELAMRQARLDEALRRRVPARHRMMHRPVAPARQEMRLQPAPVDAEIERRLLGEELVGAREALADRLGPQRP